MNPATMTRHSNGASVAKIAEFSSYFIVHKDHTGFVIGSGGATVKDIAAKTNTWIRIQPVNEWSFGHPWFLIKGRSEDVVAKAHHYIMTISNEAEQRHPRWSIEPKENQFELTDEDQYRINEYYRYSDIKKILEEIEDCHEFNATLTNFECTDLEKRLYNETKEFVYEQILPPCTACEQGIENQQGHYGECIADPYDEEQTVRARAVEQLVYPRSDAKFWSDYEEESYCFEHHNGEDANCEFCVFQDVNEK
jgi:hypothetical protein